jgi:hypothetical protein
VGSVSGNKVEPAIDAANTEVAMTARWTVCLDGQHGAFHGTNPELDWQYSATRARRSPAFARRTTAVRLERPFENAWLSTGQSGWQFGRE